MGLSVGVNVGDTVGPDAVGFIVGLLLMGGKIGGLDVGELVGCGNVGAGVKRRRG